MWWSQLLSISLKSVDCINSSCIYNIILICLIFHLSLSFLPYSSKTHMISAYAYIDLINHGKCWHNIEICHSQLNGYAKFVKNKSELTLLRQWWKTYVYFSLYCDQWNTQWSFQCLSVFTAYASFFTSSSWMISSFLRTILCQICLHMYHIHAICIFERHYWVPWRRWECCDLQWKFHYWEEMHKRLWKKKSIWTLSCAKLPKKKLKLKWYFPAHWIWIP